MVHFAPPPVFVQEKKNVPAWSLKAVKSFHHDGLAYVSFGLHGPRDWDEYSRWHIAVVVASVFEVLKSSHQTYREQARGLAKESPNVDLNALQRGDEYVRLVFSHRNELTKLFTEYKWELERLGMDTKVCERNLLSLPRWVSELRIPERGEANRGFPDVPPSHWAADALTRLRRDEIVSGHPSGKWNGQ